MYPPLQIFAYLGLLWYFEHICVGTKKSPLFCLSPSYWFPASESSKLSKSSESDQPRKQGSFTTRKEIEMVNLNEPDDVKVP